MRNRKLIMLQILFVLGLTGLARGQTFTTLYNFCSVSDCEDGSSPEAALVQSPTGNLYGITTGGGGTFDDGVVYQLSTSGTETVFHSFSGSDGEVPEAPLVLDSAGNIYGTTISGGSSFYGTVFKIDTAGIETVLYSFTGEADGCDPAQGLVVDHAGNLYGTTEACGLGYGTIFKIDSAGTFTVLHSFGTLSSDGANPSGGHLTIDSSGDLYGVTFNGDTYGVLYKLTAKEKFIVLHAFKGATADGCNPYGTVFRDTAGNFYGTTNSCGSKGYGVIWKVSSTGQETILHNFAGGTSDGCNPAAGVIQDLKGNLYGLTPDCGAHGLGALYKLSATGKLTLLHSFDEPDGAGPTGELLRTSKGAMYGTTSDGGNDFHGTAWSYVP